ncbi:PSD1 and planctomycete cytochrome C domain-containing protein [Pirellulaceae bacterium SH501]
MFPITLSRFALCSLSFLLWIICTRCLANDNASNAPEFFRGVNLNGPSIVIDGNRWDGSEAPWLECDDKSFENQNIPLSPPTDDVRAKMIRSSRWGGNRLTVKDLPPRRLTLFLYVWEDNNSETYSIFIDGREVVTQYRSGNAGHWEKLGPWFVSPTDGRVTIASKGGAANFSGLEIWNGEYDGLEESPSEEGLAFFEKRIRPLLVEKCYECHSSESEELGGNLLVDSRSTLRRGGSLGPAVVPRDEKKSLLLRAVHYEDDLQMPPDEPLSKEQIADLEHWIRIGAPDPRITVTKHAGKKIDLDSARQFWSLRPLRKPTPPSVQHSDWPFNDIDRFILKDLEDRDLSPAPLADKRTLIRRATFDLTGLPPTQAEVDAFLSDSSDDAMARLVDRLLESPQYGVRWGRHWLDVVRYSDTAGDNSDFPIPQMAKYRDWVIDAINRDLPFDEFVRDQIAGDLRDSKDESERQARIIATGYLANSRRFGSRVDDYPWHLTIEDTIDNLGRAFLGITINCARCHDHKFDPITSQDYYGLYGIFASTQYPWPGIELDQKQRDFIPLLPAAEVTMALQKQKERDHELTKLNDRVKILKKELDKAPEQEKEKAESAYREAEKDAKAFADQSQPFETAYAVTDKEIPQDAAIQFKGEPTKQGDMVRRRFPAVLGGGDLPIDCTESGRRELAEWILSDQNPITARVIANRVWQYHFGRGIVPTPNDFGKQGKPPTHPELLDYLASRLKEHRWSLKKLHREIMLSRIYQTSSFRDAKAIAIDPANDWLAGFRRQRLDAESIRDTLLFLGGNLKLDPAPPHPFPAPSTWKYTQHNPFKAVYDSEHRSVYLMTQRIQRHPFLATFDGADPSTSTGARSSTTTPIQALTLLNDPLIHEQAERIANRVLDHASDQHDRLQFTYHLMLGRPATNEELTASRQLLTSVAKYANETRSTEDEAEREAWQSFVRAMIRLNEFIYID